MTTPQKKYWILPTALSLILTLVILTMGVFQQKRSESRMTRMSEERAMLLIRAIEASSRFGMLHSAGSLRGLLNETVALSDIYYIAITNASGRIVMLADPDGIGKRTLEKEGLTLHPSSLPVPNHPASRNTGWQILSTDGVRHFLVQGEFKLPPPRRGRGRHGGHHGMRRFLERSDLPDPTEPFRIYIGMGCKHFDSLRMESLKNTGVAALAISLFGILGIFSMFWFQSLKASRAEFADFRTYATNVIRQKEKDAALGKLAAGVAHEIRNPLSSIKGFATHFKGRFPAADPSHEAATVMIREVDRLDRVISELLNFTRPSDIQKRPTKPEDLIQHALKLIGSDAQTRGIRIETDVRTDREVPLDPDRMIQVMLNLCLNGIQAMKEGGTLSIHAEETDGILSLSIRDTGPGIPETDVDKIFDPYFTTKPQGTGLGLSVVRKIMDAHDGDIHIHSTPSGTTFDIRIPTQEILS